MAQTKEAFFARLEEQGVAMVRTNLATNVYLVPHERVWVLEFLERSSEATSYEQLALARQAMEEAASAADEASAATRIAITAKRIAIASMMIAIVGIAVAVIVPHYWR